MKIRFLKEWAVPLLVTLLFSIVTVSWIMLTVSYWTNTLEPRLRKEAQGYADLLVQSHASILVDILQKESNPTRIKAIMDSLVLGRDPVNNLPFFKGIELKDIMYDSVPSKRGSVLMGYRAAFQNVKIVSLLRSHFNQVRQMEMIGRAYFQVSDAFFQKLKDDIKRKLIVEIVAAIIILGIAWIAVLFLVTRLQRQILYRQKAELTVEEQEKKYHRLVHNLNNYFVYRRGFSGEFVDVSSSIQNVLGYTPNEFIAKFTESFASPSFNRISLTHLAENDTADSKQLSYEAEIIAKDRKKHIIEFSDLHLKDDQGIDIIEGIARDITEQRKIEQELREAKEQAESSDIAKSEFLATMSHEIRTPMNAILGFTEILVSLIIDKKQQKYLSSIQSSGKTLLSLINDVLDLSKIEAGKMNIEYQVANPISIFEEIEQIFSQRMMEKGLGFTMKIDANVPSALMLDDIRLRQILFNMIGNAVKFTHSGTVTLSVGASECKENKKIDLNIIVEDTGIGIPEEQLQFIFGSFEQKKGQRQEEYGGTGLGLAITKRLVEMMGGEIQVKSKVGEGSSFHVVLKNITVGSVDDITTELPALDTNSIIFNEATILIADDIETNRDLVKGYLEEYSLHFLEAANGQEVIDLLAENPYPELIIMDLKMPVLDGYEATLMIKKNAQYSSIPVLALTASVMKNFDQKTEFLYDGFLKKPVTKAELVTELTRFLKYTFVYSKDKEPVGEIEHKMYPENKVSELIDKLEEKTAVWEKLSTALIMDEIEDFANQIHTLGKQYHAPWLSEWASSLKEQAEVFQIETMKKTLERFPELISQMHS